MTSMFEHRKAGTFLVALGVGFGAFAGSPARSQAIKSGLTEQALTGAVINASNDHLMRTADILASLTSPKLPSSESDQIQGALERYAVRQGLLQPRHHLSEVAAYREPEPTVMEILSAPDEVEPGEPAVIPTGAEGLRFEAIAIVLMMDAKARADTMHDKSQRTRFDALQAEQENGLRLVSNLETITERWDLRVGRRPAANLKTRSTGIGAP